MPTTFSAPEPKSPVPKEVQEEFLAALEREAKAWLAEAVRLVEEIEKEERTT